MENKIKNKGFTLLELIVAIAVLGVIATATIAVLNPFSQFNKARDAKVKSDLSQVQKALESYYEDKGHYPTSSGSPNYNIVDSVAKAWGASWGSYMNVLPKDPTSGNHYVYFSVLNGQGYYIYANLLRGGSDSQACTGGNVCPSVASNGIAAKACGGTCNFEVFSPNRSP